MTRFVDLSIPITEAVISDPPVMQPKIHYVTHETSWEQIASFVPGVRYPSAFLSTIFGKFAQGAVA